MSKIPINPQVLVWARNFRSLSEDEAAEKLNITVEKLRTLENGDELPSLSLFEDIARKYRFPQATLFMSHKPTVPELPNDFRTLGGGKPRHSFEFSVAFSAVDNFRRILTTLASDDDEFIQVDLQKYSMEMDPESVARSERERLGISDEVPLSWKSSEAFNKWRALLESNGVSVFLQKFPIEDCRGFTINRKGSNPIIVINKSEQFAVARVFTLAHEYCHLLIGEPGLSDLNNRNSVEAYCNKFAAAFLMPRSTIRKLIKTWPNAPIEWEDKQIVRWAGRLKVSRIALAIRLESLSLAPEGFSKRYSWHSGFKPRAHSGGGNPIATTLSELGSNYTTSVFEAYRRGVISQDNAEEFLRIKGKHFDAVKTYIEKQKVLAVA